MKRIIWHLPLDKLCNITVDIKAVIILKDVQEVWVTQQENHTNGRLTGKTLLNVTQFGDLPDYGYVFNRADDAIVIMKELIEAVNNV